MLRCRQTALFVVKHLYKCVDVGFPLFKPVLNEIEMIL